MLQHYTADFIFPIYKAPIKNGVISIDSDGIIQFVGTLEEAGQQGIYNIKKLSGALTPGFVNAHCHLELSHMLDLIPKHTGLVHFLQHVMTRRSAGTEEMLSAAASADAGMYENGIVAVGDISNNTLTSGIKKQSKIYYHTFIEVLGMNPAFAEQALKRGKEVANAFLGLNYSLVPHAPYSVSEKLFELLQESFADAHTLFSIHNQESSDENLLFLEGKGAFLDLYKFLGNSTQIKPKKMRSINFYLKYLQNHSTLLVHNTFSSKQDVTFAKNLHPNLYWCVCPKANLYIENTLPDIKMMHAEGVKIVVGTDSLASNDQLSIVEELMVLQSSGSICLNELLTWATLNGAEALNIDHIFGTLRKGSTPGLIVLDVDPEQNILSSKISRLY